MKDLIFTQNGIFSWSITHMEWEKNLLMTPVMIGSVDSLNDEIFSFRIILN